MLRPNSASASFKGCVCRKQQSVQQGCSDLKTPPDRQRGPAYPKMHCCTTSSPEKRTTATPGTRRQLEKRPLVCLQRVHLCICVSYHCGKTLNLLLLLNGTDWLLMLQGRSSRVAAPQTDCNGASLNLKAAPDGSFIPKMHCHMASSLEDRMD